MTAAQEIAIKIGLFYLAKHNNDYAAAQREIESLRITNIVVASVKGSAVDSVEIHLSRPGLLIGRKGENVGNLTTHLGIAFIKIVETNDWLDWLVPIRPDDY